MDVDEAHKARDEGGEVHRGVEVRLFDHAGDFATRFRHKLVISTQSDGSLCLISLVDDLLVSQPTMCDSSRSPALILLIALLPR
jgi:hypothetical protein